MVLFTAKFGSRGNELCASDGTEAGTYLLKDINPGSADSYPKKFTDVGDVLYFIADDGEYGRELYRSDGTDSGTWMVTDINPGAASSFTYSSHRRLSAVGSRFFFAADDGVHGIEMFISDGTEAGTIESVDLLLVTSLQPRANGRKPRRRKPKQGTCEHLPCSTQGAVGLLLRL